MKKNSFEAREKRYLEDGGSKCPVCGSREISAGMIEIDASQGYTNVDCAKCGATWKDIWELVGIDNLEEGT